MCTPTESYLSFQTAIGHKFIFFILLTVHHNLIYCNIFLCTPTDHFNMNISIFCIFSLWGGRRASVEHFPVPGGTLPLGTKERKDNLWGKCTTCRLHRKTPNEPWPLIRFSPNPVFQSGILWRRPVAFPSKIVWIFSDWGISSKKSHGCIKRKFF